MKKYTLGCLLAFSIYMIGGLLNFYVIENHSYLIGVATGLLATSAIFISKD